MLTKSIFRISFWILFGGLILMQVNFAFRVQARRGTGGG